MADSKIKPHVSGNGDDIKIDLSGTFPNLSAQLLPDAKLDPAGYDAAVKLSVPMIWGQTVDQKDVKGDIFLNGKFSGNLPYQETPATFGFSLDLGYKQTFASDKFKRDWKWQIKAGVSNGNPVPWKIKTGLVVEQNMKDGKGTDLRTPVLGVDFGLAGKSGFEIGAKTNIPVENVYLQFDGTFGATRNDGKFFFKDLRASAGSFATSLGLKGGVTFNTRPKQKQLVKGAPAIRIDAGGTFGRDPEEDIGTEKADTWGFQVGTTIFFPKMGGEELRDIVTGYGEGFDDPISAFFIRADFNMGVSQYLGTWYMPAQCDETDWDSCQFFDDAQKAATFTVEGDPELTPVRRPYDTTATSLDLSIGGNVLDLFVPKLDLKGIKIKLVPSLGVSIPLNKGGLLPVVTGGLALKGSFEDTVGGLKKKQEK